MVLPKDKYHCNCLRVNIASTFSIAVTQIGMDTVSHNCANGFVCSEAWAYTGYGSRGVSGKTRRHDGQVSSKLRSK